MSSSAGRTPSERKRERRAGSSALPVPVLHAQRIMRCARNVVVVVQ